MWENEKNAAFYPDGHSSRLGIGEVFRLVGLDKYLFALLSAVGIQDGSTAPEKEENEIE